MALIWERNQDSWRRDFFYSLFPHAQGKMFPAGFFICDDRNTIFTTSCQGDFLDFLNCLEDFQKKSKSVLWLCGYSDSGVLVRHGFFDHAGTFQLYFQKDIRFTLFAILLTSACRWRDSDKSLLSLLSEASLKRFELYFEELLERLSLFSSVEIERFFLSFSDFVGDFFLSSRAISDFHISRVSRAIWSSCMLRVDGVERARLDFDGWYCKYWDLNNLMTLS